MLQPEELLFRGRTVIRFFTRQPKRLLLISLLTLLAVALLDGCSRDQTEGWESLWREDWQQVGCGLLWEMGVPADQRQVQARSGQILRANLVNPGQQPEVVRLTGPGVDLSWTVASRKAQPVAVALEQAGSYSFAAAPGVVCGSPRLGRPLSEPRLVVLIVVDTLRNDHVNQELMPGVTAAFAGGRRWLDTSAAASWTLPSMVSLFTSRPVLDLSTPEGDVIGIPDSLATWPQALAAAGFSGAAVVANYTVHVHNSFGRGFASYWVPSGRGSANHPDASWVVEQASKWLAAHAGEDGFIFLHLMDPHEPYRDHSGQGQQGPLLTELAERDTTAGEAALMRRLYTGEVSHVDQALAPFLAELPEHAVVAFTADHGESLGEHGCWGHGPSLFQTEVAVPLMLRGPGVPAGEVAEPVQLVDLAPTLLDLVGIEPGPDQLGRSLLRGGSDLPIVSTTFATGPMIWSWRQGSDKALLRMAAQPGLGSEAHSKFIAGNPQPPGAYLFDLDQDPQELQPQPLAGEMLASTGQVFARTAGGMVPGLQLMVWGSRQRVEIEVGLEQELEVIQAWAGGPVGFEQDSTGIRLSCDPGFPICAVACAAEQLTRVQPLPGQVTWQGVTAGEEQAIESLLPPLPLQIGSAAIWWNPRRQRISSSFDATLEKLRSLGYVE
jgi:arylsulfatase A-like enzyme